METVQIYVRTHNLKTRFKNNKSDEEWYLAFAKRNRLSLKKTQGVEYYRMDQIKLFVIYLQIFLLEKTIKSSFCHDPSKAKVLGARGAKTTRMISSPRRENTSILICGSAS